MVYRITNQFHRGWRDNSLIISEYMRELIVSQPCIVIRFMGYILLKPFIFLFDVWGLTIWYLLLLLSMIRTYISCVIADIKFICKMSNKEAMKNKIRYEREKQNV